VAADLVQKPSADPLAAFGFDDKQLCNVSLRAVQKEIRQPVDRNEAGEGTVALFGNKDRVTIIRETKLQVSGDPCFGVNLRFLVDMRSAAQPNALQSSAIALVSFKRAGRIVTLEILFIRSDRNALG
jgi:hypothetical protein